MTFYKYNGAGNDFLVADNRDGSIHLTGKYISEICDRHYGVGADGVMLLGSGRDGFDFTMDYYNSDGSGGMMCGNGGRCIVAFAAFLGLKPSAGDGCWRFWGPDGEHEAYILRNGGDLRPGEKARTVRLKMRDISVAEHYDSLKADHAASGWFIDTGTRHFVRLLDTPVDEKYVDRQGRNLRGTPEFASCGGNGDWGRSGESRRGRDMCMRNRNHGLRGRRPAQRHCARFPRLHHRRASLRGRCPQRPPLRRFPPALSS